MTAPIPPPPPYPETPEAQAAWRHHRCAWNAQEHRRRGIERLSRAGSIHSKELMALVQDGVITAKEADATDFDDLPAEERRRFLFLADAEAGLRA